MDDPLRIGLIGCGALALQTYIPTLLKMRGVEVAEIVDRNPQQLTSAAKLIPSASPVESDKLLTVDAALVVTPSHTHATISMDLLKKGIHVLVEKPMALTLKDCHQMVAMANEHEKVLSVGLVRRYFQVNQWLKQIIDNHVFGHLTTFEIQEGRPFTWPLASDYMLHRSKSGGGVLMDIGVHVLDLVQWWCGKATAFEYWDDDMGGVESECRIEVEFQDKCKGVVQLSRIRHLQNIYRFEFEKATVHFGVGNSPQVTVETPSNSQVLEGFLTNLDRADFDPFQAQLEDFIGSIRTGSEPTVAGSEALRSIEWISECYQNRRSLFETSIHY